MEGCFVEMIFPDRKVPLHIHILFIFMVLVLSIVGGVVWYFHSQTSSAALQAADLLMEAVGGRISERVELSFEPLSELSHLSSELPGISEKPSLQQHPVSSFLRQALEINPQVYALYMGFEDGDFFEIISINPDDPAIKKALDVPDDGRFAVYRIFSLEDGKRVGLWKFLDENGKIAGSRIERAVSYDPRRRPWYKAAIKTDRTITTDFYIFESTKKPGISMARRFDGIVPGVFSADLTLDKINQFLSEQKFSESSELFIFNGSGKIIAYSEKLGMTKYSGTGLAAKIVQASVTNINQPVVEAFFKIFESDTTAADQRLTFLVDGVPYIGRFSPMPETLGNGHFLGIAVSVADFIGPIENTGRKGVLGAAVLVILAVPFIIWVSRLISLPLRDLVTDAEAIQRFEVDSDPRVNSRIKEIASLSDAMATMKQGLANFGKYVPVALVRQLIDTGVEPELGGDTKTITIMFTDVENFTDMSELMGPRDLMRKLSSYMERLSKPVMAHNGTIDKFIGDAIMAIWNAPQDDPRHVFHGCMAMLAVRAASEGLNREWEGYGNPIMRTRLGLHAGETIIGNVGSSDRMEYTSIGASVNMAARLEGLNKYYGTQMLVSDAVAVEVKDLFLFRSVDIVTPKGTTIPLEIYELIGALPGSGAIEKFQATDEQIDFCNHWEQAMEFYRKRRFSEAREAFSEFVAKHGEDSLAGIYAERSQNYVNEPPGEEWTGVKAFKTK